jgi:hypothetical protein
VRPIPKYVMKLVDVERLSAHQPERAIVRFVTGMGAALEPGANAHRLMGLLWG